jgi:hypothetical protein
MTVSQAVSRLRRKEKKEDEEHPWKAGQSMAVGGLGGWREERGER